MIIYSSVLKEKDIIRFWKYVEIKEKNECWIWKSGKDKDGYGRFSLNKRTERSHRISYLIKFGIIDSDLLILHICDNASCVNPDHLFQGTFLDNNKDRYTKGRSAIGSSNGSSKISERDALEIRTLYLNEKLSLEKIGKIFGIGQSTVRDIAVGNTWKHLKNYCIQRPHRLGSRNKIDFKTAQEIRNLHNNKYSNKELSILYNLSPRNIRSIINNKIWKEII